jgi:hypothetical protein
LSKNKEIKELTTKLEEANAIAFNAKEVLENKIREIESKNETEIENLKNTHQEELKSEIAKS